jgi:peptidoglycan/xylan/chitin deacetylase (PgdA/CDA1 family)
MSGRFDILVYHRIDQENSLDGLTIAKKIFIEQMQYIRSRCKPMALGDLVQLMIERKAIPPRAVAVTFDDGYADTYHVALPILKRFKIPATVFITTGFIDKRVVSYQNAPMMTWGMVKKMQLAGVEIGAHTITHPKLTQCSLREAKRQIIGSKDRLEKKLRKPVQLFAYPYGGARSFNRAIQKIVRQAGFFAACTTIPGRNGFDTDRYTLRRLYPVRDQVHYLVFELNQAIRNGYLNDWRGVKGVNKKMAQTWTRHYKHMSPALLPRDSFNWTPTL